MILIIHDIDQLRFDRSRDNLSDFKLASYIISHNQKMTNYLISNKIDKNKIVNLEIFDYLISAENISNHYEDNALLCYAGNLKSPNLFIVFQQNLKVKNKFIWEWIYW